MSSSVLSTQFSDLPKDVRNFVGGVLLVCVAALVVREYFVVAAVPEAPIRGDIAQYMYYAWNLLQHGTFSVAPPGTESPIADSLRGPGYPLLLAFCMALGGTESGWYFLALQLNVLLGTASCALLAVILRPWLGSHWSLGASLLLAFWPHHIAASAALLIEVLFGFLLLLSFWLLQCAERSNGKQWSWCAGLVLGYAYLTNSLVAPLASFAVVLLALRNRSAALHVVAAALLVVLPWTTRNLMLDAPTPGESAGRAAMNFVQGSWPQYHRAAVTAYSSEVSQAIIDSIGEEHNLLDREPAEGLRRIGHRIAEDPTRYAYWYLLEKPWLLWDWDIRIGEGDVHFHRYRASTPLETSIFLRGIKNGYRLANPFLFAGALIASAAVLIAMLSRRKSHLPYVALLFATAFIYLTLVHTVFQAEPRYANAYRWLQIALSLAALKWAAARLLVRPSPSGGADLETAARK